MQATTLPPFFRSNNELYKAKSDSSNVNLINYSSYSQISPNNSLQSFNFSENRNKNKTQSQEKKNNRRTSRRNFFTEKEDHLLTMAAIKHKKEKWSVIAKYVPGRTPKQCRDRWVNYLQPSLTFEPWTEEEDELLVSLVNIHGTHWSKMITKFPNRSTNSIKNRWYWLLKNEIRVFPNDIQLNNVFSINNSILKGNIEIPNKINCQNNIISPNNDANMLQNNNVNSNSELKISSSTKQTNNENQKYFFFIESRNKKNNPSKKTIKQDIHDKNCTKFENPIRINQNFQSSCFQFEETDLITFTPEELNW